MVNGGEASQEAVERARLGGRRAAHIVVLGVAVAFVGASAWQIVRAVFGLGIEVVGAASSEPSESGCARGLQTLSTALDRACVASGRGAAEGLGGDACGASPSPEWSDGPAVAAVAQACGQSSAGLDAWAALLRLRSAQEQMPGRSCADLAPLRRDLAAHLPPNLR